MMNYKKRLYIFVATYMIRYISKYSIDYKYDRDIIDDYPNIEIIYLGRYIPIYLPNSAKQYR